MLPSASVVHSCHSERDVDPPKLKTLLVRLTVSTSGRVASVPNGSSVDMIRPEGKPWISRRRKKTEKGLRRREDNLDSGFRVRRYDSHPTDTSEFEANTLSTCFSTFGRSSEGLDLPPSYLPPSPASSCAWARACFATRRRYRKGISAECRKLNPT